MFGLNIDKKLITIKAHYFLWNAGIAPVVPFMSVYARQLGFSSVAVGIIYTVSPLVIILIKPLTGAFADKFKCQNLVFLISQLIIILSTVGLIFLPSYSQNTTSPQLNIVTFDEKITTLEICTDQNITVDFKRDTFNLCEFNCTRNPNIDAPNEWNTNSSNNFLFIGDAFLNKSESGDCFETKIKHSESLRRDFFPNSSNESLNCYINCQKSVKEERTSLAKSEENHVYKTFPFWILFFVFLTNTIGDAPHKYGYQRMFGALGWGIFSIGVGFIIDAASTNNSAEKNYTPAFILGAGMMVICLIVSTQLKYTEYQVSKNIFKDITRVLSNIRIIVFILWCLYLGVITTLVRNYLFWLLDDLAKEHGSEENIKTIQGIVMGVRCLGGELPFFFFSSWLLKRVKHVYIMNLILLLTGIRFFLYSILSNPWWCIPVELLNGLTFGIYYSTMTSYASIIAPAGTKTTTQGLVGAVYEGAGNSLGALIGGFLYDDYGGAMTFRIFGYTSLIVLLLFVVVQLLIKKFSSKEEERVLYGPQI